MRLQQCPGFIGKIVTVMGRNCVLHGASSFFVPIMLSYF